EGDRGAADCRIEVGTDGVPLPGGERSRSGCFRSPGEAGGGSLYNVAQRPGRPDPRSNHHQGAVNMAPARSLWSARKLVPAAVLFFSSAAMAAKPDPSAASERPDPASVQRYGPGYRYPRAGWIVLHVEGAPYDRGYQHGRLLAPEIADYVQTLAA